MRQQSYFRVQAGDRNVNDLLNPEQQISYAWGHDYDDAPMTRRGISVCDSIDSLQQYLASSGIPFADTGWVMVELEGYLSDDDPIDGHKGEYLIHPTRIVAVTALDDQFIDQVGDIWEALYA